MGTTNNIQDNLLNDYISLLNPENTQEMLVFAVTNLDTVIEGLVDNILTNPESYLRCMNLIDIHLPSDCHVMQIHILETINKYLTE